MLLMLVRGGKLRRRHGFGQLGVLFSLGGVSLGHLRELVPGSRRVGGGLLLQLGNLGVQRLDDGVLLGVIGGGGAQRQRRLGQPGARIAKFLGGSLEIPFQRLDLLARPLQLGPLRFELRDDGAEPRFEVGACLFRGVKVSRGFHRGFSVVSRVGGVDGLERLVGLLDRRNLGVGSRELLLRLGERGFLRGELLGGQIEVLGPGVDVGFELVRRLSLGSNRGLRGELLALQLPPHRLGLGARRPRVLHLGNQALVERQERGVALGRLSEVFSHVFVPRRRFGSRPRVVLGLVSRLSQLIDESAVEVSHRVRGLLRRLELVAEVVGVLAVGAKLGEGSVVERQEFGSFLDHLGEHLSRRRGGFGALFRGRLGLLGGPARHPQLAHEL
mmetsp:Transcript_13198/g.51614  ORF Transcript_13198/g.51614 Transcript_13198/m.51614 type:complete len:386 (+) Transcript_13198:1161-2318(+)